MATPFPLGRHEDAADHHDARSLGFPAKTGAPVVSRKWRRYGYVLDQGNLGSCTGNAGEGCLSHAPFHLIGSATAKEPAAVALYSAATRVDPYPGSYPPTDTGSDGLAIAKVLQSQGRIVSYAHAFGVDHLVASLMYGPLIVGTDWLNDMFYPDSYGVVHPTGSVAGGHEYVIDGLDVKNGILRFQNSWGSSWGDYGHFYMDVNEFGTLLAAGGDAILFSR